MDFFETPRSLSTRRILALWFPRLPTDRLKRVSPFDPRAPLVVSAKANNALYVYALNAAAEALRLHKGQPLANARAMVEGLRIVPADEKADAALMARIAQWCECFTPLVALERSQEFDSGSVSNGGAVAYAGARQLRPATRPNNNLLHGLLLDITGAAHLFGGEAAMLSHVLERIGACGFVVRGAIAGTSLAARALAHHAPRSIVPLGGDAAAVAPLPIAAFDCDEKIGRALSRAGLKTVGQVASRDRSELSERLGKAFVTQLDVMLGCEEQPIVPLRPLPDLMAEQRFAEPVVTQDIIAASLKSLAQSLHDILEREGRGARLLEAVFFRADGKVERIAVKTGAPLRDPQVMLRLLNERLDTLADPLDPGFGFDLIRLEASLAEETRPATASFDAHENARWQVEFLIDRLTARFGEHRVQRFVPQDTHIPEAAGAAVPAQGREFLVVWKKRDADAGDPPRRPLRLFEKPEEITAGLSTPPDGAPKFFRWRRCRHDVVRAEGPERIAMEWWRSAGAARDYFRVETQEGQRFWLYRDGPDCPGGANWYLHGIFA
jgi:protein ImuB